MEQLPGITKTKLTQVMLRMPPELLDFLRTEAPDEMRSLNGQIVQILKHYQCGKKEPKKK